MLTALGSKEAEMRMIGCDLHAAQQTIAMLDCATVTCRVSSDRSLLENGADCAC
jgi:hypothetical protein